MISAFVVPLVVFLGILAFAGFIWFWWGGPKAQVPSYLKPEEIKLRELQDKVRQTNYQVLAAFGLLATFGATLVQLTMTSRQWSSDYDLRLRHEQAQQFAEAAKELAEAQDKVALADQAAQRLYALAIQNPADFERPAHSVLASVVRDGTKKNEVRDTQECRVSWSDLDMPDTRDREDAPAAAQAAMIQLGSAKLAAMRRSHASAACDDPHDNGKFALNFDHFSFDNFDLSRLDLSCARMPQARLHRVSLRDARLFGADLRGAQLADWEIPHSPASAGLTTDMVGFDPETDQLSAVEKFAIRLWGDVSDYFNRILKIAPDKNTTSVETKQGESPTAGTKTKLESWQTYRCFITDLRNADLRGADLENAGMGGADLRGADLTGANLCGANISRANFMHAKGLKTEMFLNACVGHAGDVGYALKDVQPIGLREALNDDITIKACPTGDTNPCGAHPMNHAAAYARINQLGWWPKRPAL
jgi:uncharacterized protein YjbI with pentapeptide repeats